MAAQDTEEDEAPAPKAPPRWRKFVLIGVGVLLLTGISIGLTLMLVEREVPASAPASVARKAHHRVTKPKPTPAEAHHKPLYLALDPAFVVNLQDGGAMRFLQVGVEVMTYQKQVVDALKLNMPQIRDHLVMLFSSQTMQSVSTLKGKEQLRREALAQVRQVMQKEIGEPGVAAVYFTSFVMQ